LEESKDWIIDYEEIVNAPEETLKKVYEFCELEYYSGHYFENLSNPSPENDDAYGIQGLHDVRKKLGRVSPKPEEILGDELVEYYDNLKLEFWK
jgi:sulfotransferase